MENANPYTDKLNRWSSHQQIAAMLEDLPKGARVLDVGAGSGTLARLCKEQGYYFCGIEPHAEWLGDAKELYAELFHGSLEETPGDYLEDYSAVVCADVLEHLVHPKQQLERLINAQSGGCLFIISVPNIANLWVRINLLFGRFDYADKGILDNTHLHFYTKKTFLTLLRTVGLEIQELRFTPIPLELAIPSLSHNTIGRGIIDLSATMTKLWPTLLGYQWIAKATKSKPR